MGKGGGYVLLKYVDTSKAQYILNLGSGDDTIAKHFLEQGKLVWDVDLRKQQTLEHPSYRFMQHNLENDIPVITESMDTIILNHVLEHISNTLDFLNECYRVLKHDGLFCIAVPPFKHRIVSGHITLYNMGLLMYNLALAGFDVINGRFKEEGCNLMAIVKRNNKPIPFLNHDAGDLETLIRHGILPSWAKNGFDGNFKEYNWTGRKRLR